MIELPKQVGEPAKQVMVKERCYALEGEATDVEERLGNERADVIAQVMGHGMVARFCIRCEPSQLQVDKISFFLIRHIW